jgi:nucleoside 2-deoxyribosyltransferase
MGDGASTTNAVGPYTVYAAGGLFTLHELATNVWIKEAVWRLSCGRFRLVLPQSKELRELDRPDLAAYIRNHDLVQVLQTDVIVARFDGPDLDAGTVVEFMMAKYLGKPAVILRCDYRHLSGEHLESPYNLMVKSWPRTIEVHVDSLMGYIGRFAEERAALGGDDAFQRTLEAEFNTVQKGVDEIANELVAGLEAAIQMASPYPPEYQEVVYRASRYGPGGGFDQLLTESELEETIERLRKNGTF